VQEKEALGGRGREEQTGEVLERKEVGRRRRK
jgi:hypothetical protein